MGKKKRQCEVEEERDSSDSGEATAPPCPHIKKSVTPAALKKVVKGQGLNTECTECQKNPQPPKEEDWDAEEAEEGAATCSPDPHLWMCLQCGSQLCSRSKNQHALEHFNKPRSDRHEIVANTTTWQVYCYSCQKEVPYSSAKKLQEIVEFLKRLSVATASKEREPERDIGTNNIIYEPDMSIQNNEPSCSYMMPRPSAGGDLPGVSGLYNFGNTCFFNSVMQCLVQTPYLPEVLIHRSKQGLPMRLEGGKLNIEDKEVELSSISGELGANGVLTDILTSTLLTLSSPTNCGVYKPKALFNNLCTQFPQFGDGEQHDSHELLRQLLEGVRNEDLRRYQAVVLNKLNLDSKEKRLGLDKEKRQIVKFYGQKAAEKLLGPDQVFRGFLVSTLECQECQHTSDRTETFLDLSLPVTAEKPQPPAVVRRKGIPEEQINCVGAPDENKPSKHQLKKERQASRRMRKSGKRGSAGNPSTSGEKQTDNKQANNDTNDNKSESKSSSEQSDADVEDNLEENTNNDDKVNSAQGPRAETAENFALYHMESGYNSEKLISSDSIRTSPVDLDNKEKSDGSPERLDKEEPLCLSATAIPLEYRPLSRVDSPHLDSGVASPDAAKSDTPQATSKELGSPSSLSSEINMDSPRQDVSPDNEIPRAVSRNSNVAPGNEEVFNELLPSSIDEINKRFSNADNKVSNGDVVGHTSPSSVGKLDEENTEVVAVLSSTSNTAKLNNVIYELNKFKFEDQVGDTQVVAAAPSPPKYPPSLNLRVNENPTFDLPMNSLGYESSKFKNSPSFFPATTVSPRYQCDEGEYSVQSCLSQFTASELLAGNNKVGCDACTKRANSEKTVYTNATKRFLISSPPAVLILHLKRFQIGPRCMFRKITKHVNFPLILDIAPFCSDKIRSLPIVSPNQTKLLYSLYGVVEHSGSMHGGHYVAYVKVRPKVYPNDKRWNFLPTDIEIGENDVEKDGKESPVNGVNGNSSDSSMSGYESGEGATGYTPQVPEGKWYYISDSRVQEISQDKVLKTQAYLLFYERIM